MHQPKAGMELLVGRSVAGLTGATPVCGGSSNQFVLEFCGIHRAVAHTYTHTHVYDCLSVGAGAAVAAAASLYGTLMHTITTTTAATKCHHSHTAAQPHSQLAVAARPNDCPTAAPQRS